MEKFIVGLVILLLICVAIAMVRKLRGGSFFPAPDLVDGKEEPQSLKELVERNRREKDRTSQN